LKLVETDGFSKLRDIGIEVVATKSLDEFCMDDFICDAVFYCFGLDQELLLVPKEQWPKEELAYGWKKHQHKIKSCPIYNDFLLSITQLSIHWYLLSYIPLSHIIAIQNIMLSIMVKVHMDAPLFSFVWVWA
jgi:hypothetical protein